MGALVLHFPHTTHRNHCYLVYCFCYHLFAHRPKRPGIRQENLEEAHKLPQSTTEITIILILRWLVEHSQIEHQHHQEPRTRDFLPFYSPISIALLVASRFLTLSYYLGGFRSRPPYPNSVLSS